jgi:hypothetical protein
VSEVLLWVEKMDALIALCQNKKVRHGPSGHLFPRLGEVLALVKGPRVKQE